MGTIIHTPLKIKEYRKQVLPVTDKKKEPVSAATPTGSGLNPKFNDENTKNSR